MTSGSSKPESFAERYQSVLVPVIFQPWAMELIRRAVPVYGEHILDLACGTGVVTRQIVASGAEPGSLTAVDHSPDMLQIARLLGSKAGIDADWVEADAGKLPFRGDRFDIAFCQQALQFFPDRPAALRELRRVLKKGGRAHFCVQKGMSVNPLLQAQAKTLDKHVGAEAGNAVRAICSLPDADEIRGLFEDAGFSDIQMDTVSLDLFHPDGRAFAMGAMGGMHTGDKLSDLEEARIPEVVDDFLAELGSCFDGTALHFPHVSNVVSAHA